MPWQSSLPDSWTITPKAIDYIAQLGSEQAPGLSLQLGVQNPLSASAEIQLGFQPLDTTLLCYVLSPQLNLQLSADALPALEELSIDFITHADGQSELEINAPCLYGADSSKPLIEQIRLFFEQDIAPALASHKGGARLEKIGEDGVLHLEFFGGCQGCSLSSATLKTTIKERLQKRFPQVKEIADITRHEEGASPYA